MEKFLKKYLLLILSLIVVLAMAGCTNDDDDDNDDNNDDSAPVEITMTDSPYLNSKMNLSCIVSFEIAEASKVWVEFSEDESFAKSFYVGDLEAGEHESVVVGMKADSQYNLRLRAGSGENETYSDVDICSTGSLPADGFPQLDLTVNENPPEKDGYLFFTAFNKDVYDGYVLISDMEGNIVFYHLIDFAFVFDLDFDDQRNMYYTVEGVTGKHYIGRVGLDGSYWEEGERFEAHEVSTLNSYHHEVDLAPDGTYYALGVDVRQMTLAETQESMQIVADTVIQLDSTGALLNQWSTWDYLGAAGPSADYPGPVPTSLDSIFWTQYGIPGSYDWTHANALLFDWEAQTMIISFRHLSSLFKIDMTDNSVIWRMGKDYRGDLLYDFSLTDGEWFYRQHAPAFLPNGNLIMYDNGYSKAVAGIGAESWPVNRPYSRIAEYELDETAKTIKEVWQYREGSDAAPEKDFYSDAMGDVDFLDGSGNFLITSSQEGDIFNPSVGNHARILVVTHDADPQKLWEMKVPDWSVYRAEWFPTISPEPSE